NGYMIYRRGSWAQTDGVHLTRLSQSSTTTRQPSSLSEAVYTGISHMTFLWLRDTLAVQFLPRARCSTLFLTPKTRSVLWRRIFLIEQVIVGIGLVAYALLVSMNQRPSLRVTMIATLTVGNLLVPVAIGSRRLYVAAGFQQKSPAFFTWLGVVPY